MRVVALTCLLLLWAAWPAAAQDGDAPVWNPNVEGGRYQNPIIYADYSDPDVVRVGEDFYMTSSSFNAVPALPILHSKDLVNWRIINHAVDRLPPDFDVPQHEDGVWAPSFNYHDGEFYIYWGDPDRGVYMVKAEDPRSAWEKPVLVKRAEGWIDPAPLWDDDGNAYLVHAFANSRADFNSVLHVAPMSYDGTQVIGESREVFDGHGTQPTIEGPKFYKRGGTYYIFAPAGGVRDGWQTVLRSDDVYGPYETKIVLEQGDTDINGPHQGAWVHLESGQDWFVHFQEDIAYGRIVHLQPMRWENGWPVMGQDEDGDGTGEPVRTHDEPDVQAADPPRMAPQTSDAFGDARLGLQWQWHGNPHHGWYSLTDRTGHLRLFTQPLPYGIANMWSVPNLLLQKLPAPAFTATTEITFRGEAPGSHAGLIMMGRAYAYTSVRRMADGGYELVHVRNAEADGDGEEQVVATVPLEDPTVHLRANVADRARVQFAYSTNGEDFDDIGGPFQAREGGWIGAKVGLFAVQPDDEAGEASDGGYADFDSFRITE